MLTAENITKCYGAQTVISDARITLNKGDKCALVGANGSGKSTFLRILTGLLEPDTGVVTIAEGCRIGYFPQELGIARLEQPATEYLKEVTGLGRLEAEMARLEPLLDDAEQTNAYCEIQQTYIQLGGYEFEHRMKSVLAGFGFADDEADRPLGQLSGGQRAKVALAGVLLQDADILLLDEPTNNLDLPAIAWLEAFLNQTKAACLIVSHDRHFLDRIVSSVFEIKWFNRHLTDFTGTYSAFISYKLKKIRREWEEYRRQREERKRLEESSREKKQWAEAGRYQRTTDNDKYLRGARRDRAGKLAQQAKALDRQIEQMETIVPTREREALTIPLVAKSNSASRAITLSDVVAGYRDHFEIGPISLDILFGKRIGIIGRNGVGKTTLLNTLVGKLDPVSGQVSVGADLIIGDLAQSQESLPLDEAAGHFLTSRAHLSRQEVFSLLHRFHLGATNTSKSLCDLSPGERSRVVLALFAGLSANVLVLDEPTNHLDIDALDALENVLETYAGTVVFVSHDRHFLETTRSDHLYELRDGSLHEIPDIKVYLKSVAVTATVRMG